MSVSDIFRSMSAKKLGQLMSTKKILVESTIKRLDRRRQKNVADVSKKIVIIDVDQKH